MAPRHYDVIVVGGGPAGGHAALSAAACGVTVALVDEQRAPGGQIWRQRWQGGGSNDADNVRGDELRAALERTSVDLFLRARVWSISIGFRVDAVAADGPFALTAPKLVAATGAHERIVPFEGWTLPGVMGLAAATILLKSEQRLPGQRVVVAGRGPLLAAVAAGIVKGGGKVVAVVDASTRSAWLRRLTSLASNPPLLSRGASWMSAIVSARTPILSASRVVAACGSEGVERVIVGHNAPGTEHGTRDTRELPCDALVIGDGLTPGADIPKLLRAEMEYRAELGGWIPAVSDTFETSLPGLYAIGDGAGVRGGETAAAIGSFVGAAIGGDPHAARLRLQRALKQSERFRRGIADAMAVHASEWTTIGPDTIVCRCEDVTRAEIESAVDEGAIDLNQLKHFTRCGMEPCQGRMCGEAAQALLALRTGRSREAIGYWTPRPPLRPVGLDELIGEFAYDDIPIPEAAPL